jgi:DNA repair exonuclease SbcCD ATPase subunit
MKEEKEEISAIGTHLTMMMELIIIRMLQPMKDMINELKSDVDSIKEWCAEYISVEKFNELVISMQDMKSDVELSINEAINSMGREALEQITDIEDKINDLDCRIDDVEDSRVDNESNIEDNESSIQEILSKLGAIGDILND